MEYNIAIDDIKNEVGIKTNIIIQAFLISNKKYLHLDERIIKKKINIFTLNFLAFVIKRKNFIFFSLKVRGNY